MNYELVWFLMERIRAFQAMVFIGYRTSPHRPSLVGFG